LVTKRENAGEPSQEFSVGETVSKHDHPESLCILYLADCRSPHTQRYARFFKGLGHDVHIFDTSGFSDNLEGIKRHFPAPVSSHAGKSFEEQFVHNLFSLNRVIEDIKPDVLHGHYISGWGWWGAFTGFQPYFLTAWGSDLFLDPKISDFNRRFTEFCIRRSCLITADSRDLLNEALAYGGKPGKMHYVPFGIDLDFFKDGYETDDLRNSLKAQGKKVVLSPRQFKEPANIDVIIKAIPEVISRFPDTVFVLKTYLTGENDPYEARLRDLIGRLNLEEYIRIVRDVDFQEMPNYYNLADVVLTLRDTDGTACTILETMACKTPVIAGRIKSMEEWITDGENGLLVDQHDPGATAKTIIRILGDESASRQMADAAYRNVHEKADYRKNWDAVNRLYGSEVQRNGKMRDDQLVMNVDGNVDHTLKKAWAELWMGRIDEAEQRFQSLLSVKEQVMVNFLQATLGLAKIHWLKGDLKIAAAEYTSAIRFLAQVELDQKVTLTKQ
jgi:glycosyltransferase involved in cell wall biosynthesis